MQRKDHTCVASIKIDELMRANLLPLSDWKWKENDKKNWPRDDFILRVVECLRYLTTIIISLITLQNSYRFSHWKALETKRVLSPDALLSNYILWQTLIILTWYWHLIYGQRNVMNNISLWTMKWRNRK